MASRTLTVKLVGDSSSVERMFGRVSGQASTFGRNVVRGATVAAGAVAGVGTAAFSVANTFADLSEAQSKAGTVLGDGLDEVAEFAETAAERFGLSERAATEMAASFGQLLKPTVGATDELGNMTAELSGLAADLASFNNLNPEDVGAKLFSGLSGEAEPLKALGVFLTASSVEAKALELGLADASGEVSEAAKVQARYALILEQTADAHGDFARTAEGLPNQQRRMAAEWENLRAELGERFAPVFADLISLASDALPRIGDAVTSFLNTDWGQVWRDLPTLAADAISAAVAAGWGLLKGPGVDLMRAVWEGVEGYWSATVWPWLQTVPGKAADAIGGAVTASWEWLKGPGVDMMAALLQGVGGYWVSTVWPWLQTVPGKAADAIGGAVTASWEWLKGPGVDMMRAVWQGAVWFWDNHLRNWLEGLAGRVGQVVVDAFRNELYLFSEAGHEIWYKIRDGASEKLDQLADWLEAKFRELLPEIDTMTKKTGGPLGMIGVAIGAAIWKAARSEIFQGLGSIANLAISPAVGMMSMFGVSGLDNKGWRDRVGPVSAPSGGGFGGAVADAFGSVTVNNIVTPTGAATAAAQSSNASTGVDPFGGIGGGAFVNLGIGG